MSNGLARRGVLLGGMAEDWHWIDGSERKAESSIAREKLRDDLRRLCIGMR